jgi:hypothetical protein
MPAPAWFIVQLVKPPGMVVLVWHNSQAVVPTGIWVAGLAVTPALTPWQLAQPVVMPVWLNAAPRKLVVLK